MRRSVGITALLSLLALLLGAAPVGAAPALVKVQGSSELVEQDKSNEQLWSDGTVDYLRGRVLISRHEAEPPFLGEGMGRAVLNYNLNTETYEGVAWGTFSIKYQRGWYRGAWFGRIQPDAEAPGGLVGNWRAVARGHGGLAGTKLYLNVVEYIVVEQSTYEGVIVKPHAR